MIVKLNDGTKVHMMGATEVARYPDKPLGDYVQFSRTVGGKKLVLGRLLVADIADLGALPTLDEVRFDDVTTEAEITAAGILQLVDMQHRHEELLPDVVDRLLQFREAAIPPATMQEVADLIDIARAACTVKLTEQFHIAPRGTGHDLGKIVDDQMKWLAERVFAMRLGAMPSKSIPTEHTPAEPTPAAPSGPTMLIKKQFYRAHLPPPSISADRHIEDGTVVVYAYPAAHGKDYVRIIFDTNGDLVTVEFYDGKGQDMAFASATTSIRNPTPKSPIRLAE